MASLIYRFWNGLSSVFTIKTTDEDLERQVRQDLSFLFSDYGAVVISNYYDWKHFGNAYVDVRIEGLYFHVVRDRGDIVVYVTPNYIGHGTQWVLFESAIRSLRMNSVADTVPDPPFYKDLAELSKLLQPLVPQLQAAFSKVNYGQTSLKIARIREVGWERIQARVAKKPKGVTG